MRRNNQKSSRPPIGRELNLALPPNVYKQLTLFTSSSTATVIAAYTLAR